MQSPVSCFQQKIALLLLQMPVMTLTSTKKAELYDKAGFAAAGSTDTTNTEDDIDILSPETIEAIDGFKAEMMSTRSQLRSVKFDLRRDVENLKKWVIAFNVAILPVIFASLALIISFRRKKSSY